MAGEIPPHVLNPDYWDDHYFDDDCPWHKPSARSNKGLFTGIGSEHQARSRAAEILKVFIRSASRAKLRDLNKGDTFDSKDYPLGTVIHYNQEQFRQNNPDIPYTYFGYWGVTVTRETDIGSNIILARFFDSPVQTGAFTWAHEQKTPIEVGRVEHFRLETDNGEHFEDLKRTKDLEIWKMGQGMPEREAKRGFSLGRLVPGRVETNIPCVPQVPGLKWFHQHIPNHRRLVNP